MERRRIICFLFIVILTVAFSSCSKLKKTLKYTQAQVAYNHGKFDQAAKIYGELVALNPKDPMLHWYLGISYYSGGRFYKCEKQIAILRTMGQEELAKDLERLVKKERGAGSF